MYVHLSKNKEKQLNILFLESILSFTLIFPFMCM